MTNKRLIVVYHVLGCLAFLSLPLLFSRDSIFSKHTFESALTRRDLASYLLMIGFFYLHYYRLIPGLYFRKKYLEYVAVVAVFLIVIVILPKMLIGSPPHMRPGGPPGRGAMIPIFPLAQNFFLFLMVIFFSFSLRINEKWKQVQKEKVSTELAFLKAQINPHFLFNTLNSIYALAIENSGNTAEAVVKLSGMMRYVLSDASQHLVNLEKELGYVRSFVEFQQIRFGDEIALEYQVEGNPNGKKIAPLVLIPFIENAFKYGVNAEEDSRIRIRIRIRESELTMEVANNKVTVREEEGWSHGLGIENARKRLDLIYPGRYTLEISDDDRIFTVLLHLNLDG
ncbi:MAG: sensor histidine kinase [Lewinella sp.]|nr:sensor histidine kinase [Lewinella sp.]